jgi:hypothetical protein
MFDLFVIAFIFSVFSILVTSVVFSILFYILFTRKLKKLESDTLDSFNIYVPYLENKIKRLEKQLERITLDESNNLDRRIR